MEEVFICGYARTPFGAFQGALATVAAPRLGASAIVAALKNAGVAPELVDEVMMGNVLAAGCGQAPARQAAIYAGIPNTVPCMTINKVCGSGMKSVMLAAMSIAMGHTSLAVAGGMESMSLAPYLLPTARKGFRMGNQEAVDSMIHDGLWDPYNNQHMGMCGELCAKEKHFTREGQDAFAIRSYERALEAAGMLSKEITPIEIPSRKGSITLKEDEGPGQMKLEKVPSLRPAFDKEGTITAANASSINDGAAALVLASASKAKDLGLKPLAKIVSTGHNAQDPEWFTTAPVGAMQKALAQADWHAEEVDLYEVNEAFAVVPMAVQQEMGIPDERLNIWGGAISIGHPIGASGARIVGTLVSQMTLLGKARGCASICIGGGEGTAVCVEAV